MNPTVAPGMTLGSSYAAGDGYIDPPSNVLAYTTALFTAGVEVFEHTSFEGLTSPMEPSTGVQTSRGRDQHARASYSPAGRPWPRSARQPAPGSSRVAPATRWS